MGSIKFSSFNGQGKRSCVLGHGWARRWWNHCLIKCERVCSSLVGWGRIEAQWFWGQGSWMRAIFSIWKQNLCYLSLQANLFWKETWTFLFEQLPNTMKASCFISQISGFGEHCLLFQSSFTISFSLTFYQMKWPHHPLATSVPAVHFWLVRDDQWMEKIQNPPTTSPVPPLFFHACEYISPVAASCSPSLSPAMLFALTVWCLLLLVWWVWCRL